MITLSLVIGESPDFRKVFGQPDNLMGITKFIVVPEVVNYLYKFYSGFCSIGLKG